MAAAAVALAAAAGGHGPSGGSSGSSGAPAAVGFVDAVVIQVSPTLGDYGATLRVMNNRWQVIEAQVEIDKGQHDLKKVVVSLGVVWLTKFTQNGDGTLDSYNASTDTYYFHVSVTKIYGDFFANTRTLYGEISPSNNTGRLYFPD